MILDCGKTGIDGTYLKYKSSRINPDMDLERVLKFVASQDVKNELEFENRFGLPEFFISSLFDRDYSYPFIYYLRLSEIMEIPFCELFFFCK